MKYLVLASLALMPASAAGAKVVSSVPHGFEIVETTTVSAEPARVYAALARVADWWDGAPTCSAAACNDRKTTRLNSRHLGL